MVEPYVQRFELREIYDQVGQSEPSYADFWVVAESGAGYLEWYDPATGEFGLGIFNGKTGSFLSLSERVEISSGFFAQCSESPTNAAVRLFKVEVDGVVFLPALTSPDWFDVSGLV